METEQQWCDQTSCPAFGKIDIGNIKVHSGVDRRYTCTRCGHTFSADTGTFFETLRTDRHTLLDAIAMLVERNSLRAISRIKHCKLDTIRHWLDLAGQHAAVVSEYLIHGLHLTQVQIDELWTFVKKNRRTLCQAIHLTAVTPGFGKPLLCPVMCGLSIISVMSATSIKQQRLWPYLKGELTVGHHCLPATSCPLMSPP